MKKLTEIANKFLSDKGSVYGSCHKFTEIYDEYFHKFIDKNVNILEIGIQDGSSLKMWNEFFNNPNIIGLDISDKSMFDNENVKTYIVDQSNEESINNFKQNINIEFDIIIDDGSHHMRDQQLTLGILFPYLKSGGIYVLEDLHTSLCDPNTMVYGRPIEIYSDRSNTTLEFLKKKPYKSVYLDDEKNQFLVKHINNVNIFDVHNPLVPNEYKNRSVTSIIEKI